MEMMKTLGGQGALGVSRRRFLINAGLLVTAVGVPVTACSSGKTSASRSGNIADASGDFEYWSSAGDRRSPLETYVRAFEKENPKIKINVSYRSTDTIGQQVQTALAAGRGPDLVPGAGPADIGAYADAGLLLPLDGYAESNGWADKLLPWALASGKVRDVLYALPTNVETLIVFYNKTLFEKNGYSIPKNGAELAQICADLEGSGVIPFAAGNADFQGATDWWVGAAFNHFAGAEMTYKALTGERPWTDAAFVDAIALVQRYFQRGWVAGGVKRYFTATFDTYRDQLASGKAAMLMSGSWEFAGLNDFFGRSGQEYDWFPIPALNSSAQYPLFVIGLGDIFAINKSSDNPDAVAAFLNWALGDRAAQTEYMRQTNSWLLPVPLTKEDLPESINRQYRSHVLALVDATKQGNFGYTTWTFFSSAMYDFSMKNIDQVISGAMTPEQFCAGFQDVFAQDHSKGLVPHVIPRS